MAEDGYRTENISISSEGSSSKDQDDDDRGWLRLSLGGGHHTPSPNHQISLPASTSSAVHDETWSLPLTTPPQQLSFQVTDLRPITAAAPPVPPTFFLQPRRGAAIDHTHHQQHDNNNIYLPFRPNFPLTSTLSSPLHIDFNPPPRPYSGVWFILQASQTQTKEPYLPQVPKSYLRIKDGRTTVGLLIKYLVYKLKLDGEFEIEIRCKGQPLLPFLSLQHVRDNIWNRARKDVVFLNSSATSMDHLMVLNYGRIA